MRSILENMSRTLECASTVTAANPVTEGRTNDASLLVCSPVTGFTAIAEEADIEELLLDEDDNELDEVRRLGSLETCQRLSIHMYIQTKQYLVLLVAEYIKTNKINTGNNIEIQKQIPGFELVLLPLLENASH